MSRDPRAVELDVLRARLGAIVESSDDAIISKDLDGVITSWNRGATRLFGYTADEIVGRPVTLLFPPDRLPEEDRVLAQLRKGERIEHYETVRRRKDGTLVDISLSVSPLFDPGGRVIGASKIARDITDRKRSERALQEADRRKDEFIATLAHELRNPLAPLRNGLDFLRMQATQEPAARIVGMMDRQLGHLVRLVDDLLEISRVTRGLIELRREPVALEEVLRGAVEIARTNLEAGGHRLELSLPTEPLVVSGDATRLTQVVANLLNNAAKFTPHGGLVRLVLDHADGKATIRVIDNGIGIEQDMLERVFEMFAQVRGGGSLTGGLGIGLSLVRRLVEMHGGKVEAHSQGPGAGSQFVVCLPLIPRAAPEPESPLAAPPTRRFKRVLVVDDNRDAAESLALLLRTTGDEVWLAHSGGDALALANRVNPEVVLLDLGLPDVSGHEVARRLRAAQGGRPLQLIAITGWGQDSDRARSSAAGFDHHLVKPVLFGDLETLLNS